MRASLKSVGFLLPLILLAACGHKTEVVQNQPLAPPIVDTPLPAPQTAPVDLPPPVVSEPQSPPPANPTPPPQPEEKPAKTPAHHAKPKNTDQASSGAPVVSAIGQLTLPDGNPSDLRSETVQSISSTENGLKGINRTLNDQEQKTVAQIRAFLKQAKTALTAGDVDGAHTLALKAKVLLGEISH